MKFIHNQFHVLNNVSKKILVKKRNLDKCNRLCILVWTSRPFFDHFFTNFFFTKKNSWTFVNEIHLFFVFKLFSMSSYFCLNFRGLFQIYKKLEMYSGGYVRTAWTVPWWGKKKCTLFFKLLVLGVYKRFFNMLGLIETVWRYTFRIYIYSSYKI